MIKAFSIVGVHRISIIVMTVFLCGCETNTYEMNVDATQAQDILGAPDAGPFGSFEPGEGSAACIGQDICERQPQRVPRCSQSLEQVFSIDGKSAPGPGSNQYQNPSIDRRDALFAAMASVDMGEPERAMQHARQAGYTLCHIQDVYVLFPDRPKLGGARVAWRSGPATPAILEAPHTFYDIGTNTQALELFLSLRARAVVVSGTHRCASERTSRCDGTGQICSRQNRPFKDSDMAHSTQSFFQSAHEYLSLRYEKAWILSLHGMSDDGLSVSDGTTNDLDKDAAATRFGQALMEEFSDEYVSSCNGWDGARIELRLCGTTNVQGRFVNGAKSPCKDEAAESSGRFIHLEQSRAIRSQTFRVADALRMALGR